MDSLSLLVNVNLPDNTYPSEQQDLFCHFTLDSLLHAVEIEFESRECPLVCLDPLFIAHNGRDLLDRVTRTRL